MKCVDLHPTEPWYVPFFREFEVADFAVLQIPEFLSSFAVLIVLNL